MNVCPSLATIAINSYRQHPQLFIDKETLLSQEGTIQGDPLAMALYAISLQPLVQCYHPNSDKTRVVVKDGIYAEAVDKFSCTGIQISKEGREYLGSAIGGIHQRPSES